MAADVGAARSFSISGFAERAPLIEFGIDTPATIVVSVPWLMFPSTPHLGKFYVSQTRRYIPAFPETKEAANNNKFQYNSKLLCLRSYFGEALRCISSRENDTAVTARELWYYPRRDPINKT